MRLVGGYRDEYRGWGGWRDESSIMRSLSAPLVRLTAHHRLIIEPSTRRRHVRQGRKPTQTSQSLLNASIHCQMPRARRGGSHPLSSPQAPSCSNNKEQTLAPRAPAAGPTTASRGLIDPTANPHPTPHDTHDRNRVCTSAYHVRATGRRPLTLHAQAPLARPLDSCRSGGSPLRLAC